MLNRNNLTLSALSNRLNLGTRSLVLSTSVNNLGNAQRIRHTHHDMMRKHMAKEFATSIPVEVCAIPSHGGPAYGGAAPLKKACGDSWKPDAADARLVPIPTLSAGWQSWLVQSTGGQKPGSGSLPASRPQRSASRATSVESRRRPGRSVDFGAAAEAGEAWASQAAAARRTARAAVAE